MFPFFKKKKSANPLPWFTVNFDSSTGLVNALNSALHEEPFGGMGDIPESELLAKLVNHLPQKPKLYIYRYGSATKAVAEEDLGKVRAEEFSRWVVNAYPQRKYPAIAIGSSNGAAVHLCAAMGIPWLPQTFFMPVQTPGDLSVDDPVGRMQWAEKCAKALLSANPNLQLHHMMDPNQDRPMLPVLSYFRVKLLHLDECYQRFIEEHLEEGGTIITIECNKTWPVVKVDERHFFQFGGLGGTTIEEYFHGSKGVAQFLKEQGAEVSGWNAPKPDLLAPESEWGFIPTMLGDAKKLAKEKGYNVQRLVFEEPEDLSPLVAELYRSFYQKQGVGVNRLFVGMFSLMEPYMTLQTGSIPYWMAFNGKPSVDSLKAYLHQATPYERIYLMPFSNGIKGQGQATVQDYRSVFDLARDGGDFIGAEPEVYPFDFGIYARYERDLQEKLKERFNISGTVSIMELKEFLEKHQNKFSVKLLQEVDAA